MEDKEIVSRTSGLGAWLNLARLMELIELTSGNLIRISPHFQCNVISTDPDDRAFTDCAIAANADYIITEDAKQRVSAGWRTTKTGFSLWKKQPSAYPWRSHGFHVYGDLDALDPPMVFSRSNG